MLRLGALIPRSVGQLVGRSSKNSKKHYKTLKSITKRYKTLVQIIEIRSPPLTASPPLSVIKTVNEATAVCRSFLDGVVIHFDFF